jgi:dTDP-4-dehydrorhamnose 3,5-epimerase
MKIQALALPGVLQLDVERQVDARGSFARLWCRDELARAGVEMSVEQTSASFNARAGTLRGLHFAWPPAREAKIVRCARGRLHDVALDLRPASPTFGQHLGIVLDADAANALYLPPGVAHGFQTLVDATEVHYMMSEGYRPELGATARFDDPHFGIAWPLPVTCIAERDRTAPAFDLAAHCARFIAGTTDAA